MDIQLQPRVKTKELHSGQERVKATQFLSMIIDINQHTGILRGWGL